MFLFSHLQRQKSAVPDFGQIKVGAMSRAIPRGRLYHVMETQLQYACRPGLTKSTALHDTGYCNNTAPYLRYPSGPAASTSPTARRLLCANTLTRRQPAAGVPNDTQRGRGSVRSSSH